MVSKSKEKILKTISILVTITIVIGLLIRNNYSANDNHYVLDVVSETATESNDNVQVTEKIVKGKNGQFDSKTLNYEVELKNIAQNDNVETQVAIVIDTSYSMGVNDSEKVVNEKAKELAEGILTNVKKSRVSISNNNTKKLDMIDNLRNPSTTIQTNIENTIKALGIGDNGDGNNGLQNAISSFTSPLHSSDSVNKYIIVFTDGTDNVKEKMEELKSDEKNKDINIISILVDITSNSYIKDDNTPVNGDVYLLLSGLEEEEVKQKNEHIQILDLQEIYDNMNRAIKNIEMTNIFSDGILNYFNILNVKAEKGTIEAVNKETEDVDEEEAEEDSISAGKNEVTLNADEHTGYKWKVEKLKYNETAKMTFTLELKANEDIEAGLIFNNLYTNKTQDIKYVTYKKTEEALNGTDAREGTQSTVIKICQGYDLKIKAVNESNTELAVEDVQFKVVGVNEEGKTVCDITRKTDSKGYITITADDARALRSDGKITFTVTPDVNKVGYSPTESVTFEVENNKTTKKIEWVDIGATLKYSIREDKRLLEVEVPINSQKMDFELKVEELNNSNVVISGAEFQLIQPQLNDKYKMDVLTGTTDENGIIHFSPTVMTKNGEYDYILRQVTAPDNYDVTELTLITITFENGKVKYKPTTQFNSNVVKSELCEDKENHVLIVIGNECVAKDPFDLQINLKDIDDGTALDGVTYLIRTINENNISRSEYATTNEDGQINAKLYGNGNMIIQITEQSPKVGYVADTQTKELTINRKDGIVTIWSASPTTLEKTQSTEKNDIIVNLYSKKKVEQNVVKVTLVDSEEVDVPVGAGVKYTLKDTENETTYGPVISDRNGELSFVIDTKEQGPHKYILELDDEFIPDEYDLDKNKANITLNVEFGVDGYISGVNTVESDNEKIVIAETASRVENGSNVEYTAFIKVAYEMNKSNTFEFNIKLSDFDDETTPLKGASYNVDIEWDVGDITRTKTIIGRQTNDQGLISTRIVKGDEVRITVKQVGATIGYNMDVTTQEIRVKFGNNGQMIIDQGPYELKPNETNSGNKEDKMGAKEEGGKLIYNHLNKKRSVDDTYLNLTINKKDTQGAYVDGVILNISSKTLKDKNNKELNLILKTGEQGSQGTATIDYESYIIDKIKNDTIRVPDIGTTDEEKIYDLEITEMTSKMEGEKVKYEPKEGTTVKLRLIFRYKDERVTLTNVETIYGNRLVENKEFSSSSDTDEGKTLEDTIGIFLSNITLDLYTNYDDVGNLSIDFKKKNSNGNELNGAKYTLKITNPDTTVIRKEFEVSNGDESSDIEISGINVNEGTTIELTETKAPVGYSVNTNTETLEVTEIDDDGQITIVQKDSPYKPERLKIDKLASSLTSAETTKTNYEVTFIDYSLDVFEFEIKAVDSETQEGVQGYTFKIDTDHGATNTLITGSQGVGTTRVGGSAEDDFITYTISGLEVADYYKPLGNPIQVKVKFDPFGNVDTIETINANTEHDDSWQIIEVSDSGFGKIAIQIKVEHQDPLVVKIETKDKITNEKVNGAQYKITPSAQLEATGSDEIEVGYVLEKGTKTYTLTQTNELNSYKKISDILFTVTYNEEKIVKEHTSLINEDKDHITFEVTEDKEITITILVEPKVPFEITNKYYFNKEQPLQGAKFEVTSLDDNQETAMGTTNANGMTGIYSDIFKTETNTIYKISQISAAEGYATIDDFFVKVTFGEDRKITEVKLVNQSGEDVEKNRFVEVNKEDNSTHDTSDNHVEFNKNEQGIVAIEVLNYPEFQIKITDVDRRYSENLKPVVGTEYSVKSTYNADTSEDVIEFTQTSGVITDENGLGIAHLDKTKDNKVVTYTITETSPATNYQTLGTEIKMDVTFDENGYIEKVSVKDDDNLRKIEKATKEDNIDDDDPEDAKKHFIVNLELKNNPILKFDITAEDSADHDVKIRDIGFQITAKEGETKYSNSSATNRVNQTETPETSYTDVNGKTDSYLDRTLDNKKMIYTIKEVQKSPGYEWEDEDIEIEVSYDENGQISSTAVKQGDKFVDITGNDKENFVITLEIFNDEIKEFGIHLSTIDTYNKDKKLNDMKVEAFLTEPGNNSYTTDGEYELVDDKALLTGADRNEDGKPDLAYGEDYEKIGKYEKGNGTRTLRLIVKNDAHSKGYYLDTTGENPVGHYKGTQYFPDARYQRVEYQYLISVTFDDEGKITAAGIENSGSSSTIGWCVNENYIEVTHTNYKLTIVMKFFPMLDLKLNAMDNYTYQDEIDENGEPIALEGSKYTIRTQRASEAYMHREDFVTAGYIGNGNGCEVGETVYGSIYRDTDELLVPIENNHTRNFYVFEEIEPTNYQKYRPRYVNMYSEKLVAIISITFDKYGEIDYDNSIVRNLQEDGNSIKPYMNEEGTQTLSKNNLHEYNYHYTHKDANRNVHFYIGYALTTRINVTAVDDISGTGIANVRMYPFVHDTYKTNTSYEFETISYRTTSNQGKFDAKYWGAAEQNKTETYIIGSSRIGNNYNGYLFPSDMASSSIGGNGNEGDYYAKLDITYGNDGKISNVQSVGSDLWGDNNVSDITWDKTTGNVYINMLYSRKFQMSLNKIDYYDSTINRLSARFNIKSNRELNTSISARKTNNIANELTPVGKVYKNTTVKYTLSEEEIPQGYYPITDEIDFYVTFDENGNITRSNIKSDSEYFEVENTNPNTERVNKTSPDLTINIKNKPAFNLDLRVIDKFYKNDGVSNIHFTITDSKELQALGNPQTDENGYALVMVGPVYPNETITYTIKQNDKADDYYKNETEIKLEVEFNNVGKIQSYSILSGDNVVDRFNESAYMNTRKISMNIMNMPEKLYMGLYKFDKTTKDPMSGVRFTITKTDLNSQVQEQKTEMTTQVENGAIRAQIDKFEETQDGRNIKYTIHEEEVPGTYRKMEDVVFIVRYNADGSIASCNQVMNDNEILNTNVVPQVAIGSIKYLNKERVHFLANIPNDNAFDIIIKNKDAKIEELGVEGSTFNVNVNATEYTPEATNELGMTIVKDITEFGEINIRVAQDVVGDGYAADTENHIDIKLNKGTEEYSLELDQNTEGFSNSDEAHTTKADVKVDEEHGTITITFKNKTKTELTLFNEDINTKQALQGAQFKVTKQQIGDDGQPIEGSEETTLTSDEHNVTDDKGMLYFDLGEAPISQIWKYTFTQNVPPETYNEILPVELTIKYDQNGRISEMKSSKESRLQYTTEHEDNQNCRSIYAIIYNGDISPAYTVKVVTEDADTGKRINGSSISLSITDENGGLIEVHPKTAASAKNGDTTETKNLGIDGNAYTDAELNNPEINTPIIIEKGLVYIDNIDYKETLNIDVSEIKPANGYIFGEQITDGDIKIKATYKPTETGMDPEVEFEIINNGNLIVNADSKNRIITITIKNESQVTFDITTKQYQSDAESETIYIEGVSYNITSEIQTAVDSKPTGLNVNTSLSDQNGKIIQNVEKAYAGKTVLYTLHQNISEIYKAIDDIQVEVQYDSRGYIKYYEILSSEDNCYIDSTRTSGRTIALVVQNKKVVNGYRVDVEKHAMDTEEDLDAYGRTLPGAKYEITVQQQFNGAKTTTWTDVTNEDGLIKGLTFSGIGYIDITITELEAPEGYQVDTTKHLRIYRDPDTGEIEKIESDVNINDTEMGMDEYGNTIIKLMPINAQRKDRFTLVINKISSVTNKFITDNQAEFKAELMQKDEEGNITYQDTLGIINTDKTGKATIDNLKLPDTEGTYNLVITEIKAPEGYVQLTEPIEIPVTFEKTEDGNIQIQNVNIEGLENVSISTKKAQILGLNIKNDVDEPILEDEYSLDITKVDAETNEPISNMALFKVLLPDEKNTSVYTETKETILGEGKLDYCYIEQDKDYGVRLTHMKLPTEEKTLTYVFKEVLAPEGYALIKEELTLSIEFAKDPETGEMIIKSAKSSNPDYLKIKTQTPCPTNTRLEIDILNNEDKSTQHTIHYEPNDNDEGTIVPEDQIKENGINITLSDMIPEREGYVFAGWSARQDSRVAEYQPGDVYSQEQDITLYAIWEVELYIKSTEYIISDEEKYIEDAKLEENIYEEGDKYILGLAPKLTVETEDTETEWTAGTTLDIFTKNIDTNAESIKIYNEDNEEITDSTDYLGTTMIAEFTKGKTVVRLILIVRGDLNGDGILNLSDTTKAKRYIKLDDESILDTTEKKLAYDVNFDGRLNMKDTNNMQRAQANDDVRELDE